MPCLPYEFAEFLKLYSLQPTRGSDRFGHASYPFGRGTSHSENRRSLLSSGLVDLLLPCLGRLDHLLLLAFSMVDGGITRAF
jgi:hypothetical protein